MLEFRLLGQFDVRADGTPLVIPSRLLQSLLAYLLVHHTTTHRREKLAGVFWPDTSETKARGNLRQSLWRLRKALDATSLPHSDLLLSDDLSVGIDPQTTYWLDVAQFEAVSNHPSTDNVLCPLDVYQGELLPDFYDEWVALERDRLHALFEQQVERLLEQLCADQRWKEALTWAERWIALGRSPEPAYRALMLSQSALGNRSQVVAVFERCAAALKADLAVEPSEETRGLYEQLLKDEGGMQKAEGISSSFTPALPRTPLGAGGVAGGAGVLHPPSFVPLLHPFPIRRPTKVCNTLTKRTRTTSLGVSDSSLFCSDTWPSITG